MHPIVFEKVLEKGTEYGLRGMDNREAWTRCNKICSALNVEVGVDVEACVLHCMTGWASIVFSRAKSLDDLITIIYDAVSLKGVKGIRVDSREFPESLTWYWKTKLLGSVDRLIVRLRSGALKPDYVRMLSKIAGATMTGDEEVDEIVAEILAAKAERHLAVKSRTRGVSEAEAAEALEELLLGGDESDIEEA